MIFVSNNGMDFDLVSAKQVMTDTAQGQVRETIPAKSVKFRRVTKHPYDTRGLDLPAVRFDEAPGNKMQTIPVYEAWYKLDTEEEAFRLGIPEADIVEALYKHEEYGRSYRDIAYSAQEESDGPNWDYMHPQGDDDEWLCTLCDTRIKGTGPAAQHIKSKGHLKKVASKQLERQAALMERAPKQERELTERQKNILAKMQRRTPTGDQVSP